MGRVVVGVDGSDRSKAALRRAAVEARLRGASVEAVYVYAPTRRPLREDFAGVAQIPTGGPGGNPPDPGAQEDARRRAHEVLARAVDDALADTDLPRPRLVLLPHEEPARALTDHAEGAEMLVIGIRQRSPVGKLVLGSDARDTILQAGVPVLSVQA